MIDAETRRNIMLQQEGIILHNAGASGSETAAAISRAQVDGHFNALLRLEPRENVTSFAFSVSDRVAGGLREATDYKALVTAPIEKIEPPVAMRSGPTVVWRTAAFWWGFFYGAITLAFLTFWRAHS